ncbi:F-box protein [Striga hermonthica]|uniref:F-box protein n=1 Tax=Striga hermonthica TaxID=68872 RepID=A0A9N7MWU2_STRHE|nr:F-box protein [Striga hermonthica]
MDNEEDAIRIDFLQFLETDVSVHIMSFLDDPADVVRASAVSRNWRQFVISNGLAKHLCIRAFPQLSEVVKITEVNQGKMNLLTSEARSAPGLDFLERQHKIYASLHRTITKAKVPPRDCIETAVSASSTDRMPDESILNTLNPRDRYIRTASYWSSKGQSDPSVPETLVYKLKAGIWVITEVDIQPFEAFFQIGSPLYSAKASAVSRSWRHFVIANGLCKKLWLKKVPQVRYITCSVEENDGIIKLMNVEYEKAVNWGTLEMEHKLFSSLHRPFSKPVTSPKCILAFPVGASSTDRDPPVTIINTLSPERRSFWSSKGENDHNAPEYLLYRLTTSISIVTEVHIRPLEVFWENARPVYSARSVRFLMGHPKSVADVEIGICPIDRPSLNKYVWTYVSLWFPMKQKSCSQKFKLPEPVICIGGIFLIELLGRAQKDNADGLFYIRLGHVRVMGRTLEPAFHAEMHSSGELQLNYYPQSLDSVLQSFSGESKAAVQENEELCVEMSQGLLDFLDDDDEDN